MRLPQPHVLLITLLEFHYADITLPLVFLRLQYGKNSRMGGTKGGRGLLFERGTKREEEGWGMRTCLSAIATAAQHASLAPPLGKEGVQHLKQKLNGRLNTSHDTQKHM